jgi:hypothetical protein
MKLVGSPKPNRKFGFWGTHHLFIPWVGKRPMATPVQDGVIEVPSRGYSRQLPPSSPSELHLPVQGRHFVQGGVFSLGEERYEAPVI